MIRRVLAILVTLPLCCAAARAGTVNIDLVPVGDVMNLADSRTGYGAVAYPYSIGKYDVTMGQYAAFLSSVAVSGDPYGLYSASMANATPTYGITQTSTSAGFVYAAKGNSANVPVTYVDWGDAARFVNWLANGEPTGPEGPGSTETGTYALNGSTGSAALMAVTRSNTASWILPTVDEWYKAAYYVGGGTNAGYWNYPTMSNSAPSNILSLTGTDNATFTAISGQPPTVASSDPVNWLTAVGAFAGSPSTYGTYDQGGNVWQWNETVFQGAYRGDRGGSYADLSGSLVSGTNGFDAPQTIESDVGFRVASVPEPASFWMLTVLSFFIFSRIKRSGLRRA